MRIHVQNAPNDPNGVITRDQWDAVFGPAHGHRVSFGDTIAAFRAATGEAEAMLVATRALKALLPLEAPRLELLSLTSAGLEMLAPFDWLPPGVTLLNNSGTHAAKTSEYVLMALFMLANRIPAFAQAQAARRWQPMRTRALAGRRITIVGLGAIGEACADRAQAIGLHVTGVRSAAGAHRACERVIALDAIDTVLPDTDYLVLALPASPATHRAIDRRRLSLLPPHAGIVNVGRGSVIDEKALCDLLADDRLGGAVLDVFEEEPLAADHRAWTTPNLMVTPHISADDPATYHDLTLRIFAENLAAHAAGRPMPNRFDPVTGTRSRR